MGNQQTHNTSKVEILEECIESVYLGHISCPDTIPKNAHHATLLAFDELMTNSSYDCELIAHIPDMKTLHYRVKNCSIPYLDETEVDILVMYCYRPDGQRLYYKDHVMTSEWNKKAGATGRVLNLNCVLDSRNCVGFHAITRTRNTQLEYWIAKHIFEKTLEFENERDKLQTEYCILLQLTFEDNAPKKHKKRYDKVHELLYESESEDSS